MDVPMTPVLSDTGSKTTASLTDILTKISSELESEQTLKESIKESLQPLDSLSRNVTALINRVHSTPGPQLEALANQTIDQVKSASGQWSSVADKIPKGEYHRYAYQPSFILKPLVTSITLAHFLLHDDLLPLEQAAEIIGIKSEWSDRLQLSPDDYLQGVIGASNELTGYELGHFAQLFVGPAYRRVRERPVCWLLPRKPVLFPNSACSTQPIDEPAPILDLFDSLKYDVKRCEDVVYDITLRNLAPVDK
ncbi:hypothetical protein QFC22_001283 [Naganishia vaughanmartiniae]|uniref:Uncharacterized protein n=1 Tax=Naganishia vaughanmartiniae TaxID=1424756 RepID=A0ACC2XHH9_9TREE|nr:hypothetical protein QFC22_001283 [Naganishia vaughanmartiniae]